MALAAGCDGDVDMGWHRRQQWYLVNGIVGEGVCVCGMALGSSSSLWGLSEGVVYVRARGAAAAVGSRKGVVDVRVSVWARPAAAIGGCNVSDGPALRNDSSIH